MPSTLQGHLVEGRSSPRMRRRLEASKHFSRPSRTASCSSCWVRCLHMSAARRPSVPSASTCCSATVAPTAAPSGLCTRSPSNPESTHCPNQAPERASTHCLRLYSQAGRDLSSCLRPPHKCWCPAHPPVALSATPSSPPLAKTAATASTAAALAVSFASALPTAHPPAIRVPAAGARRGLICEASSNHAERRLGPPSLGVRNLLLL